MKKYSLYLHDDIIDVILSFVSFVSRKNFRPMQLILNKHNQHVNKANDQKSASSVNVLSSAVLPTLATL